MRYVPTLRLPVLGFFVITDGSVINRPPSIGQHCRMGKSSSEKSPCLITSLHGPVETSLGKNLPISASMGNILSLSSHPCGDLTSMNILRRAEISSSESTSSAISIRRLEPNWLIRTFAPGWPLMFSKSNAGPPGPWLPRGPHFDTRSVISVISKIGSTSALTRFSSPALSSAEIHSLRSLYATAQPFSSGVRRRPFICMHCRYVLYNHRIISQLQAAEISPAVEHWREAAFS